MGFIISVTKKVDQSTLPAADRIPDTLEGVPVEIREEPVAGFIWPADTSDPDEEDSSGGS